MKLTYQKGKLKPTTLVFISYNQYSTQDHLIHLLFQYGLL